MTPYVPISKYLQYDPAPRACPRYYKINWLRRARLKSYKFLSHLLSHEETLEDIAPLIETGNSQYGRGLAVAAIRLTNPDCRLEDYIDPELATDLQAEFTRLIPFLASEANAPEPEIRGVRVGAYQEMMFNILASGAPIISNPAYLKLHEDFEASRANGRWPRDELYCVPRNERAADAALVKLLKHFLPNAWWLK